MIEPIYSSRNEQDVTPLTPVGIMCTRVCMCMHLSLNSEGSTSKKGLRMSMCAYVFMNLWVDCLPACHSYKNNNKLKCEIEVGRNKYRTDLSSHFLSNLTFYTTQQPLCPTPTQSNIHQLSHPNTARRHSLLLPLPLSRVSITITTTSSSCLSTNGACKHPRLCLQ